MKTLMELDKLARDETHKYRNNIYMCDNGFRIAKIANDIMSMFDAKDSLQIMKTIGYIQKQLDELASALDTYEDELAATKAKVSVYMAYINEVNNTLKDF